MPAVIAPPVSERTRAAPLPPAERRAAVVRAVAPLLLEHGAGITTKQIAHGAGVSEGTIFNVFADKDELIEAVIEAALDPQPLEERFGGDRRDATLRAPADRRDRAGPAADDRTSGG